MSAINDSDALNSQSAPHSALSHVFEAVSAGKRSLALSCPFCFEMVERAGETVCVVTGEALIGDHLFAHQRYHSLQRAHHRLREEEQLVLALNKCECWTTGPVYSLCTTYDEEVVKPCQSLRLVVNCHGCRAGAAPGALSPAISF